MRVAKTKALISCAFTVQLIWAFVFAYINIWFSHYAAQLPSYQFVTIDNCKYGCLMKLRSWSVLKHMTYIDLDPLKFPDAPKLP